MPTADLRGDENPRQDQSIGGEPGRVAKISLPVWEAWLRRYVLDADERPADGVRVGHPAAESCALIIGWHSCSGGETDKEILVALDTVEHRPRRDPPRPFDEQAEHALRRPRCALLSAEGSVATVWPHHELIPIVHGVNHDGIFVDAQILELFQEGTDQLIVFQHSGSHIIFLGPPLVDCLLDYLF